MNKASLKCEQMNNFLAICTYFACTISWIGIVSVCMFLKFRISLLNITYYVLPKIYLEVDELC